MLLTFNSCKKDEGVKEQIIIDLDGHWKGEIDNLNITFDGEYEMFSMTSDRGDVEEGIYDAHPENDSIWLYAPELEEIIEDYDMNGSPCKITKLEKNIIFIKGLPYFEDENVKIFKQ